MRKVIYITGITCTGKGTTAKRVCKSLGLPRVILDHMCRYAGKELGHPNPRKLTIPSYWKDIPDARAVKKRAYEKVFTGLEGDLVIEGSTLFYEKDRSIIHEIIGEHESVFFLIDVSFNAWLTLCQMRADRPPDKWPETKALLPTAASYEIYLEAKGRFQPPEHFWTISHPTELKAFGFRAYQKPGFTDKKWESLKLPPLRGKTLLDLACNEGWMCRQALEQGAARALGVDYNFRYLKLAHRRGIETQFLDLEHLDRITEKFDYVLMLSALHYLRDPERCIERASHLTKELFVWEGPVSQKEGLVLEFRAGRFNNYIPTPRLLEIWLQKYFSRIECVGPSVSPDDSTRLVYHCWKEKP